MQERKNKTKQNKIHSKKKSHKTTKGRTNKSEKLYWKYQAYLALNGKVINLISCKIYQYACFNWFCQLG